MKTPRILCAITTVCLSFSFGYAQIIDNLQAETVVKELYSTPFKANINNTPNLRGKKYFGIKINNEKFLAIYHQPQQYKTKKGESRVLVHVERRPIFLDSNKYYYDDCKACEALDDLFILKQDPTGKYQVLSQTKKPLEMGGNGVSYLETKELNQRVVEIAPNKLGFFTEIDTYSPEESGNFLYMINLDESSPVTGASIDNSSGEGEEYSYTSKWKVLNNLRPVNGFYPIELKFNGTDISGKRNQTLKYFMQKDHESYSPQ